MIVSLGRHCQAAHQIRRVLGRVAKPQFFDWLITPHDGLVTLLHDRMDGFLAEANLVIDGVHEQFHRVIDRRYGVEVLHDFPIGDDVGERLPLVQAKFAHLARRFLALDTVDFVRQVEMSEPGEEDALRAALSQIFSDRFRLTMVADNAVPQAGPYNWSGDDASWERALGSIPSQSV